MSQRPSSLPLSVLVVEDESLIALDLATIIEDLGHKVVGEAASVGDVAALDDLPQVDLAFVDVQLARGSSGLDACRHIQAHWPDAIVVFVTANPKLVPDDFDGGHGIMSKPFTASGLRSAMAYLTEGIRDPPPSLHKPAALTALPGLADAWAT